MKIILAYNPFGDIKARALNLFLNRTDITTSNMSSVVQSNPDVFEKVTKFFDKNNFRKHFEK